MVGVQSCVFAAQMKYMCSGRLSVIGGGHSSNSFADDALVVSMARWTEINIDVTVPSITVGGGATIGAIVETAEKHGLVVPLGDRPGVGMGLVLQGGINHLMRSCGMATDNILRVVYVSPKGKLCVAETDEDLWPFRGAGSNFGIVLEITLQAYKLANISVADSEYFLGDASHASKVLGSYDRVANMLPCSMALDGFLFWGSKDRMHFATAMFDSTGSDDIKMLREVNNSIESIAGKVMKRTPRTTLSPSELFDREMYMGSSFDSQTVLEPTDEPPSKLRSIKRCFFFGNLTKAVSTNITHAIKQAPTKWCYVHFLHGGGRVSEIPPTQTAFGCRNWIFAAVLTGRFDESKGDKTTRQWIEHTTDELLPLSNGIYGADLGPCDSFLARRAFGVNSLRLSQLKRLHDPANILDCSCPMIFGSLDATTAALNDPRVCDRGVVVMLCGRRFAGKDWLASIVVEALRSLLQAYGRRNDLSISAARISDETKRSFASKNPGVTAEQLMHDRNAKELWRPKLNAYYESQKKSNPGYDRECLREVIGKSQADILVLTGMRDGINYARVVAGRSVVMVHVKCSDESKKRRGWQGPSKIDKSPSECSAEMADPAIWDLAYSNDAFSNRQYAKTWTKEILAPTILKRCVRNLEDCPSNGIIYRDMVGGVLLQRFGLSLCVALISEKVGDCSNIDVVLAPESMGFLFAGAVAFNLQKPIVLARKSRRLPGDYDTASYVGSNITKLLTKGRISSSTEQRSCFHIVSGSIVPGQKILVVDDCLASGATLDCLVKLVQAQGGVTTSLACAMELPDLGGRKVAQALGIVVHSLFQFEGK